MQEQTAYLVQNGSPVLATPISSGRFGHLTETGSFKILDKERNHHSSMYGKIVDARGNTIVADADADMRVPPGGKLIPAPMHYFMRFRIRRSESRYEPSQKRNYQFPFAEHGRHVGDYGLILTYSFRVA